MMNLLKILEAAGRRFFEIFTYDDEKLFPTKTYFALFSLLEGKYVDVYIIINNFIF